MKQITCLRVLLYLLRGDDIMANGNFGAESDVDNAIYYVEDAEDYMALASVSNKGSSSATGRIIIENDIDFSNVGNWTGFGITTYFYCTFEGNNKVLKNAEIQLANTDISFLPPLEVGMTLKNITLRNIHISGAKKLSVAYCKNQLSLENFVIENNCIFESSPGQITEVAAVNGAYYDKAWTINRCYFGGTYTGYYLFLTRVGNNGIIKNSVCAATLNCRGGSGYIRVLYINNQNVTVINCFSRCKIGGSYGSNGAASFYTGTISNCYCADEVPEEFTYVPLSGYLYNSFYCTDTIKNIKSNTLGTAATTAQLQSAEWLREQGWAI
jgi:hypothetical protein